jgi:hypothetical protein
MSPGSKDPKSTGSESTKSPADSSTGKMSDEEFLNILTTTQWPADLSEEDEENQVEEEMGPLDDEPLNLKDFEANIGWVDRLEEEDMEEILKVLAEVKPRPGEEWLREILVEKLRARAEKLEKK